MVYSTHKQQCQSVSSGANASITLSNLWQTIPPSDEEILYLYKQRTCTQAPVQHYFFTAIVHTELCVPQPSTLVTLPLFPAPPKQVRINFSIVPHSCHNKNRGVGRWFGKGGLYRSIGKGSMISVYKIEPSYVTIRKHRGGTYAYEERLYHLGCPTASQFLFSPQLHKTFPRLITSWSSDVPSLYSYTSPLEADASISILILQTEADQL